MDDLTGQLRNLRLRRREAEIEYQRLVDNTNRTEEELVRQIQELATAARHRRNSVTGVNCLIIGDNVRITNHLRSEHGIKGVVNSSGRHMVEICNQTTRRRYTRAGRNLKRIEGDHNNKTDAQ